MGNINFFIPKSLKGYVMEMNAGIGNLGVSAV
jgi:nitrate/nitrite transporter NarK